MAWADPALAGPQLSALPRAWCVFGRTASPRACHIELSDPECSGCVGSPASLSLTVIHLPVLRKCLLCAQAQCGDCQVGTIPALPSDHWVSRRPAAHDTTRSMGWKWQLPPVREPRSPEEGGDCPGATQRREEQARLGEQRAGREFLAGQWVRSGNNYEKDSGRPALLGIEVREADQRVVNSKSGGLQATFSLLAWHRVLPTLRPSLRKPGTWGGPGALQKEPGLGKEARQPCLAGFFHCAWPKEEREVEGAWARPGPGRALCCRCGLCSLSLSPGTSAKWLFPLPPRRRDRN